MNHDQVLYLHNQLQALAEQAQADAKTWEDAGVTKNAYLESGRCRGLLQARDLLLAMFPEINECDILNQES